MAISDEQQSVSLSSGGWPPGHPSGHPSGPVHRNVATTVLRQATGSDPFISAEQSYGMPSGDQSGDQSILSLSDVLNLTVPALRSKYEHSDLSPEKNIISDAYSSLQNNIKQAEIQ